MSSTPESQRGDVAFVGFADDPPAGSRRKQRTPKTDERVKIRLHGYPYDFLVRVATARGSEPTLAELTIVADHPDSHPVDYKALRSVPARRLAYSARQWIARAGGTFAMPDDYRRDSAQPENADPRLTELHWRIEQAVMEGLPVRETIAQDLHVGKRTVDRMIAKARALGLLDGVEIPKRPSPRQRDTLRARHLAELWLSENDRDEEPPPDLLAEIAALRGETTDEDQEADR
ncbi:hypothetical protein [Mycolicibacterium hippocampi]|uniref:Uncharacterized protein n=1 Tax=Mycolicibacterium hippocampi TaxID=659824 RepID=A0A850PVW2_9MYCO|nr:hypothetical protein [Mycolicibacterium hippocampi]NVN51686.1 hypothetical protein [Mycolicibacterium hippocampi]